jgi:3alpha(or 20beta)-hydroxysteroid dehydrogenase
MARLADKVAIVTGGARGMGGATSRLFVAEGARVAIADVLREDGAALAAELGESARYYHHDVSDAGSWARLLQAVEADLGAVDVLINNAGVIVFSSLLETSEADFDRVLGINLKGAFLGIKAVGPGMVARGRGSIVNISSIEGMRGANGLVAYSSAKWGLRGLTRVAAMELGHRGVRVNSIHPGGVYTPMGGAGQPREVLNQAFAGIPAQRVAEPNEIAAVSLFLASDEASYLMGAELVVDGGMVAGSYHPGMPGAPGMPG